MINYSSLSDIDLAIMLKADDESAFSVIYKKYWDKLYVVAGKRLNDSEEAEEVVQDIFLNLWKRRKTFELRIGFENYFAVAVKYEIINRLAKRARASKETGYAYELEIAEDSSGRFDLELLQKQLEHTICRLPPKCQLIFRMSRENDLTNKKIAKELEISEKAVEKHITYALKALRTKVGQYLALLMFFI